MIRKTIKYGVVFGAGIAVGAILTDKNASSVNDNAHEPEFQHEDIVSWAEMIGEVEELDKDDHRWQE